MADRIAPSRPRFTIRTRPAWPLVAASLVCCLVVPARAQRAQRAGGPARGAARGAVPGAETLKLTVGGEERDTVVFAPTVKSASGHPPLVLVFHGHGGSPRAMAAQLPIHTAWPEAVVAYPQGLATETTYDSAGLKPGWDSNEDSATKANNRDLALVDALLTKLHDRYSTDEIHTYAAGFSNGAMMALLLWTSRASHFAAFAADAGVMWSWKPTIPRPVLYIGGEQDRDVTPAKQRQTVASIRTFDGATTDGRPCGTGCTLYPSASQSPVQVMTHPGGHQVPTFAADAIVAFFKTTPK